MGLTARGRNYTEPLHMVINTYLILEINLKITLPLLRLLKVVQSCDSDKSNL